MNTLIVNNIANVVLIVAIAIRLISSLLYSYDKITEKTEKKLYLTFRILLIIDLMLYVISNK